VCCGAGRLIQITPQIRILVAVEPIDARKGIDSLAQLCREKLPPIHSRCLFVFRSRRGTAIKLLAYDGRDFGCHQALVEGAFPLVPTATNSAGVASASAQLLLRRQSGCGSSTGVAPRERLKNKNTKSACVPDSFLANWRICRSSGSIVAASLQRKTSPFCASSLRPLRHEPKKAVGESV